jgi:hypothetical protein
VHRRLRRQHAMIDVQVFLALPVVAIEALRK